MSLESDKKPHVSKTISYGTILTIVAFVAGQIYASGVGSEKLKTIQSDIIEVKVAISESVNEQTLDQLLENRDIKIDELSRNINEIKVSQKEFQVEQREIQSEHQKLLIELLQREPRPQWK